MLRVLQVIPTLDQAGAEKQMCLLARGLPRDRFDVEVAALTRLGPLERPLVDAGIPVRLLSKRFKLDLAALVRLSRFIRAGKFDVVHTWIFAANVYGRIAAHLAKTPCVIVSEMAVDLWKRKSELRLDRWLAGWTDRVVGNSRAVVEFYTRHGIPPSKLSMIYSGIGEREIPKAPSNVVRGQLGIAQDVPLFLFAGRLAEQKRVSDLIDAMDLLQHVEPSAVALIAGDGPLRATLERRATTFGLSESGRVRFLGSRSDVARLIDAADAVVLPSQYEGLPNIVLEAMQAAKPVIATAAPGTDELVVDGETGLLVPVGQPRELCRGLRNMARDPALRARMGSAGAARVAEHFRIDTMIAEYASLYESIATGARKRR